jgi:hypothetical protein
MFFKLSQLKSRYFSQKKKKRSADGAYNAAHINAATSKNETLDKFLH